MNTDDALYANKTDNQKIWVSKNEICKSAYEDETKCNVNGTGCKWQYMGSSINEKNETITNPAHCSNVEPYPSD